MALTKVSNDLLNGSIAYDKILGTDRPCFYAYNSAIASNGTGNNTTWVLDSNNDTTVGVTWTTAFDQNGDFDTTAVGSGSTGGIFTAPVTGKYLFTATIKTGGFAVTTCDTIAFGIIASNRGVDMADEGTNMWEDEKGSSQSVVVDMDAADTCYLRLRMNGNGSDNVDIGNGLLVFTGCLLA